MSLYNEIVSLTESGSAKNYVEQNKFQMIEKVKNSAYYGQTYASIKLNDIFSVSELYPFICEIFPTPFSVLENTDNSVIISWNGKPTVSSSRDKEWYKNGKLYRDGGLPAYEGANGDIR